jgi:glycosyltransferase involved in cell wall biosynthesis
MSPIPVMSIVDTLEPGGAERVAVNIANLLPRDRFTSYLCATRRTGPLQMLVAPDVGLLQLERTRRFDINALRRLVAFIGDRRIRILHAHGTSLFIAAISSLFSPYPAVIWHDHFGRYAVEERSAPIYRMLSRRVAGVIAVNEPLANWSRDRLGVRADRVWYLPNLVYREKTGDRPPRLPGQPGSRIVCVANFRPQKDHLTLIAAMKEVLGSVPSAHLLLVGAATDSEYFDFIRAEISRQCLGPYVSILGERRDVPDVLEACDVGVLSSVSEGFPLTLIEYGAAGLPAVATRIGQCAEILDDGQAGILVPPKCAGDLAAALLLLLGSAAKRDTLARALRRRVRMKYSPGPIIRQICKIYESVLATSAWETN